MNNSMALRPHIRPCVVPVLPPPRTPLALVHLNGSWQLRSGSLDVEEFLTTSAGSLPFEPHARVAHVPVQPVVRVFLHGFVNTTFNLLWTSSRWSLK
jgi:hypothetical protein